MKDELVYAIGNIIQNAIQHSIEKVTVKIKWSVNEYTLLVNDDGEGFSNEILDKIGQPYISNKINGMGLGIFIAKNLIENIGGYISFSNSINGGVVEIKIKRVN